MNTIKAKAFANNMTVITKSQVDHQNALHDVDSAYSDLGLRLKPSKCVSIVLDKGKIVPKSTFHLADRDTKCITETPIKFLGQIVTT